MLGKMELAEYNVLTKMEQRAASAWSGFEGLRLVGATYKPLLYMGRQVVKGTNYWFIAEQTLVTNPPVRRLVKMAINEYEGEYSLAGIEEV